MSDILLLGCGASKAVRHQVTGAENYAAPVTLDIDPTTNPDIVWDLNVLPYPVEDNAFDEIHAYEVLEHCGTQGDWKFFFAQFHELWRALRPGGKLVFTVPSPTSMWVWGDPGHSRHVHPAQMTFLSQKQYEEQVGKTPMTDYRHVYKGDFEVELMDISPDTFLCVLKAVK